HEMMAQNEAVFSTEPGPPHQPRTWYRWEPDSRSHDGAGDVLSSHHRRSRRKSLRRPSWRARIVPVVTGHLLAASRTVSQPPPSPEESLGLFRRVALGDKVAVGLFAEAHLVPLADWLASTSPRADPHLCQQAAEDA